MIQIAAALIFALLALGLPVGIALILLGLGLDQLFTPIPLSKALGELSWVSSSNSLLVSVPLFILLGEILLRSGIADRLYGSMSQWLSWLPGGLMHANIGASMASPRHPGRAWPLPRRSASSPRHWSTDTNTTSGCFLGRWPRAERSVFSFPRRST